MTLPQVWDYRSYYGAPTRNILDGQYVLVISSY